MNECRAKSPWKSRLSPIRYAFKADRAIVSSNYCIQAT